MGKKFSIAVFALALGAILGNESWGLGESPRTNRSAGWSSPRFLLASAELESVKIEPLKTLDRAAVYQLTVALRQGQKLLPGMEVEYEVHAIDGMAIGGGMFAVHQEMLAPGGNSLSVLTGFGGLKLHPRQLIIFKLGDPGFTPEKPAEHGPLAGQNKQVITDTCTTFCDRCADNAGSLCSQGAGTYSCNCSDVSRSCEFTCQSTSGVPTKPAI
jgi:hypothetical protein